jgi:hypothetical protein
MQENFTVPDFSGDDFKNDKEILKHREMQRQYEQMVDESLKSVRTELGVENGAHKNLKIFSMFRSLAPIVLASMSSDRYHVSLVQYSTAVPMPRMSNHGTDEYLFGLIEMKRSYPKTYIHKETLREKIADLVLKNDMDFSHSKKFSRKFYVLTEDKKQLADLLQFKELDQLTDYPEMELEINDNKCLFRNSRRPISREETIRFCSLAKLLVTIL